MRLLFFTDNFPNRLTPTKGVFNAGLVRALTKHHAVHVISPISWLDEWKGRKSSGGAPGPAAPVNAIAGIETPKFRVDYPRYYYPPKVLRGAYGWFYWQSVRRAAWRAMAAGKPDAVLAYWAHPDGEAAVRASRRAGVPSAVIVGGSDVLLITNDARRRRRVASVLRAADLVLCVNRHLKGKCEELGVDPGRVHVWYQGVDRATFAPGGRAEAHRALGLPEVAPLLVWVGRMVPVKALDVLVRGFALLRDRGVPARLCLVGDGPLRGAIARQVREANLEEWVLFAGARPQAELGDWYRAADLMVLPSLSEGLPNVLRESLACGTPFVASRVGGIPEIIGDGPDAARHDYRLVPPGDAEGVAAAVEKALADDSPMPYASFLNRSWDEAAQSLIDLVRPLTAAGPVSGRRDDALEMRPGTAGAAA